MMANRPNPKEAIFYLACCANLVLVDVYVCKHGPWPKVLVPRGREGDGVRAQHLYLRVAAHACTSQSPKQQRWIVLFPSFILYKFQRLFKICWLYFVQVNKGIFLIESYKLKIRRQIGEFNYLAQSGERKSMCLSRGRHWMFGNPGAMEGFSRWSLPSRNWKNRLRDWTTMLETLIFMAGAVGFTSP